MGWKRKTCIAAAMFLLYGADASLMAQEAAAAAVQPALQALTETKRELLHHENVYTSGVYFSFTANRVVV